MSRKFDIYFDWSSLRQGFGGQLSLLLSNFLKTLKFIPLKKWPCQL
jgi:hypothetical protein